MFVYYFLYRTTFSEFAVKHGRDPRFKTIEKMKDREAIFIEFITAMRKREKEDSKSRGEKVSVALKYQYRVSLQVCGIFFRLKNMIDDLHRSCNLAGCWLEWCSHRFLIHLDVCVFCSQVKQDFFDLLSEQHIEGGQRWSKVKERLETDQRYKAVESSALREELFKQYMEKQAKVWMMGSVCMCHRHLN